MLVLIGGLPLCLGALAQTASSSAAPDTPDERLLSEQKHFLECLACVYRPAWWFSYRDSLYFQARNAAQAQQLEAMKAARAKYLVFTNQEARHALAAKFMAGSGIDQAWQKKLLLPFSATNQTLTPTLEKAVRVVPRYKVLKTLTSGDALIQDDAATYFVMDFGRGADDASRTNAVLIREGVKAYLTDGSFKALAAFSDVSLSAEENAVLQRVSAAFQKAADDLGQEISGSKYRQEFEDCKARANDSSPYLEYLLAKCYLEGKGTAQDDKLGMEWMNRAARSGSGDAIAYLEKSAHKAP